MCIIPSVHVDIKQVVQAVEAGHVVVHHPHHHGPVIAAVPASVAVVAGVPQRVQVEVLTQIICIVTLVQRIILNLYQLEEACQVSGFEYQCFHFV